MDVQVGCRTYPPLHRPSDILFLPPVLELGAGTGLPSILLSTRTPPASLTETPPPTSLIVVTDHPDPSILSNLQANVARNQHLVAPGCTLTCAGYEWGTDVGHLL